MQQAAERDLDYKSFLTQALETEYRGRFQRGTEARIKLARFPWLKTLDQFDFDFQPSLDRKIVRELAGLSFIERAHNVVLLGPPGVGKTHLAIALALKAVEAGFSALFLTLEQLMTRLTRARHENRLERTLQQLVYPRVLVLDEHDRHQQQKLPRLGRDLPGPRARHRHPRPVAPPCDHAQHQGRELPAQGEATGGTAGPGACASARGGECGGLSVAGFLADTFSGDQGTHSSAIRGHSG
jgi:IstB-like ATP binding protein